MSLNMLDKKYINSTRKVLISLVQSHNPTVYSWLALELLVLIGEPVPKIIIKTPPKQEINMRDELLVIYKIAVAGFEAQALAILEDYVLAAENSYEVLQVAHLYDLLNKPDLGYQKLIRCYKKVLPPRFEHISFPRVYCSEIANARLHSEVPDYLLFALIRQESAFLPNAISWAGARGLTQLMWVSAKEQALKIGINNLEVNNLFDPKINILLGSSLFFNYWQKFKHLSYALAAYNAGPSRVHSWLKKNPDIAVDAFIENIPIRETRQYVVNVLGGAFYYAQKINLFKI